MFIIFISSINLRINFLFSSNTSITNSSSSSTSFVTSSLPNNDLHNLLLPPRLPTRINPSTLQLTTTTTSLQPLPLSLNPPSTPLTNLSLSPLPRPSINLAQPPPPPNSTLLPPTTVTFPQQLTLALLQLPRKRWNLRASGSRGSLKGRRKQQLESRTSARRVWILSRREGKLLLERRRELCRAVRNVGGGRSSATESSPAAHVNSEGIKRSVEKLIVTTPPPTAVPPPPTSSPSPIVSQLSNTSSRPRG
ncbi:hypothetical protein BDY24DRAFT_397889 [Mrakia frigida]|uniref:uncharacterized protein n=1 Tax=Mrakia frigida TaxID=29902 RepID=UPI003FCC0177